MQEREDPDTGQILSEAERVAIVGWSPNPDRASNEVAEFLHEQGYTVLPVNPNYTDHELHGHPVVGSLDELDDVDVVDVFRRSEDVPEHVDEAISSGVDVFWMQLGIENEKAARTLRETGMTVVQDRCTAIEHRKLG